MSIPVYGKPDCADFVRLRTGFDAAEVSYAFHDVVADAAAAATAMSVSGGDSTPVVVLPDETFLVEPDDKAIAHTVRLLSSDASGTVGARRFGRGLVVVGVVPASDDELAPSLAPVLAQVRHIVLDAISEKRASVAIDIRAVRGADIATSTTIDLLRGLAQSYTLEAGADAPALNLCVSAPDQDHDRAATWRYLDDVDGTMARGATFDIREERS